MRIIDNRYKLLDFLDGKIYSESYKVTDLWEDDSLNVIKFFNYEMQKELIEYLVEEFLYISTIKHKNILSNIKYDLVKTIDVKKTNALLYYSISEYTDGIKLEKLKRKLKLKDKFKILLDIMIAIDYLHFRGITYGILSPSNIFIDKNNNVKLMGLVNILEKRYNAFYDNFTRKFLSPDILINKEINDKKIDYYSIGILFKYLLLNDFDLLDENKFQYKDEKSLTKDQKELLNEIISKLLKFSFNGTEVNMIDLVDRLNNEFKLEYKYDLSQDRNNLYFKSKIVGREKEVNLLLDIDKKIIDGTNTNKGIIISADFGMGKTRYLSEITHRLKMKNRDVYYIEIANTEENDLLIMANILRQSIKDTPLELMEKYRNELSKILPELRISTKDIEAVDFTEETEILRLYNRIATYFTELSRNKQIYIVIDDIQNAKTNLINILDYLISNVKSNNIFFIFSYDSKQSEESFISKKLDHWTEKFNVTNLELLKLDLEEIGEMIQNILGISYIPHELSSVLFRESEGNPRYIEYMIKKFYSTGELYMGDIGRWHIKADDYSDIYFPSDMDQAFHEQLNVIKDKYFEVFKILSIFDGILYKVVLDKFIEISDKKIELDLEKLISLGLVEKKLADLGYSYDIKNREIKKSIYNKIPEEERIELHKKAVNVFNGLDKEYLTLMLEEQIYHLTKSNQLDLALNILLEKAKNTKNKFGSQATFLWEKAFSIVENIGCEDKLTVLENLVEIYSIKGDTDRGNYYLNEYLNLAKELNNHKHLVRAKGRLIDIYNRKVQIDKELETIREIEDISRENDYDEGRIITLLAKSRLNIDNGELQEGKISLREVIRLSEKNNIKSYLGTTYNRLGIIEYLAGNMEEAINNYQKSIKYFEEAEDILGATRPINNIGNVYQENFDDLAKGAEYYEKGLDIATRYGFQEVGIVFLVNIAEMHMERYQYDIAMEYLERVNKGANKLQDLNLIFLANINIGKILIEKSQIGKAHEIYLYLQQIYETRQITNPETIAQYYNFLGHFYGYLGQLEKGIDYSNKSYELYKDFNTKSSLVARSRIVCLKYFKDKHFDKDEMDTIRAIYREKNITIDRRKTLLYFSIISLLNKENDYALELLKEDEEIAALASLDELNIIRDSILCGLSNNSKKFIEYLLSIEDQLGINNINFERIMLKYALGYKLYEIGEYKQALKYLIDALDSAYKMVISIPNPDFKYTYIKMRNIDSIKEKIQEIVKIQYNKHVDFIKVDHANIYDLMDYFDIGPLVDIVGTENFINITQFDYYGEAVDINNIEALMLAFTEDYYNNLGLILKYLGKETFAKKGYILSFNEEQKKYYPVVSLDNINFDVNENLLKASNREEGILINKNTLAEEFINYKELISEETKGVIVIPITVDNKKEANDRRKIIYTENGDKNYIYLETDNIFNRFDHESFNIVKALSYLIYINLENNKLNLLATTDKLTNTFTRKYYEQKFNELIINMKAIDDVFSVLMLDLDKFKNINDTYGHRKGDEVLAQTGNIIKSTVRNTDIVGRYGGEEFIIILKNTDEKNAMVIAEKIRKNIESNVFKGIDHSITISIGISQFPVHSQFKEDLVEKADQALYYSKETGRNKVSLWNANMDNTMHRVDKLAGILTGNTDDDNRNILAMMDIIELIKEKTELEEKIFIFLGRVLESIEAEYGTFILLEDKEITKFYTRKRFVDYWVEDIHLNKKNIEKSIESGKGEYFIDWEYIDNIDSVSGIPNWQSVIIYPMIKNNQVKGILYLTAALTNIEFDFNHFNLTKCFGNIFAANI